LPFLTACGGRQEAEGRRQRAEGGIRKKEKKPMQPYAYWVKVPSSFMK